MRPDLHQIEEVISTYIPILLYYIRSPVSIQLSVSVYYCAYEPNKESDMIGSVGLLYMKPWLPETVILRPFLIHTAIFKALW